FTVHGGHSFVPASGSRIENTASLTLGQLPKIVSRRGLGRGKFRRRNWFPAGVHRRQKPLFRDAGFSSSTFEARPILRRDRGEQSRRRPRERWPRANP